jgi:serine/threonine protein phosphatase 1
MPKFFVTSDVHGFYDEMRRALDEAGFDQNNEDHWLVVCGDYFDRGSQPLEVMKYLLHLPRKILVRGNHEQLLVECYQRGEPYSYDYSNGTYSTICEIGGAGEGYDFDECCTRTLGRTRMFLDTMVNYFETKNYIFVHSWIPVINKDGLPAHYTKNRKFEFNPDWRNASRSEWEDAMWGNPFDMAERGLMPDKTVVFGHWHASTGWAKAEGRSEFGIDAKFDPFYGDGFISIDACTAHSRKCNVIVLEDEFLEGDVNEDN